MSLLGLFADAPPSVRKPMFELDLGGSSEAWNQSLISLRLETGFAPAVDVLCAVFGAGAAESPQPALGDRCTLSLGYQDSGLTQVFAGSLIGLRQTLDGCTRVEVANGGADLARLRGNWSYTQSAAGDLVSDLADQAGVDTAEIEDGADFAFRALGDGMTALEHIAELARLSDMVAYFDAEGGLFFGPLAPGEAVAEFSYGVDLLALDFHQRTPTVSGRRVHGEGAAGAQGQDAWCWLSKSADALKGEAGEAPFAARADGGLREKAAIDSAAAGWLAATDIADRARLVVPGTPAALPGKAITLKDLPNADANGTWLVLAATHRLAKGQGFTTTLELRSLAGAGFSLGGLL